MKKKPIVDEKPRALALKLFLAQSSLQVFAAFLHKESTFRSLTTHKLGRQMLITDGFALYKTPQLLLSNLRCLQPHPANRKTENRIKHHNTKILKNSLSIRRLIIPVSGYFFGCVHA
ncbi:MAG: hypothetical protein ABL925_11320 [Methylococcales bacterium]